MCPYISGNVCLYKRNSLPLDQVVALTVIILKHFQKMFRADKLSFMKETNSSRTTMLTILAIYGAKTAKINNLLIS